VKQGLSKDSARHLGGGPKFLFSGLLKCGKCGGKLHRHECNHIRVRQLHERRGGSMRVSRQEAASTKPRGTVEQTFPRMEAEYRELVAGIERVLTKGDYGTNDPRLVARSRAALQVRYGEIRVEVTPDALEFRSTQGIEAALARVAGGDSQIMLVAGVGFGFSCPAHNPPRRSAIRASERPLAAEVARTGVEPATNEAKDPLVGKAR